MEWLTVWFYMVLKLDDVKLWLDGGQSPNGWVFISGISIFILTAVIILAIVFRSTSKEDTIDYKFSNIVFNNKKIVFPIYGFLLMFLVSVSVLKVVLPSTKQAMALVTVDLAIKNKDTAIKTGADLFNIVDEKVEKYLRIIVDDTTKKVASDIKDNIEKGIDVAVEGVEKLKSIVEVK